MKCHIKPTKIRELNKTNNLFQSGFWASFRSLQQYETIPFRFSYEEGEGQGVAVLRPIGDGYYFAYLPWAPDLYVDEEKQGQLLESLACELTPLLSPNCLFIRFDPFWESPYEINEESESEPGDSGRPPPRIRELRMNFNTRQWNLVKAPTNVQPVDTIVLDIRKDPASLLSEMKSKTRYNIRLSERQGVTVEDASIEALPYWYELYTDTMKRKGITVTPYSYFKRLFSVENTFTMKRPEQAPKLKLLMAKTRGEYLGGIVLIVCGNYAMYLYGASSLKRKELMANYRLQWEAIKIAQQHSCYYYDLHGIPVNKSRSNPMFGLFQFKRGFGGRIVHRRGCWDYPVEKDLYKRVAFSETGKAGYYRR